jgi:hypothetical protein
MKHIGGIEAAFTEEFSPTYYWTPERRLWFSCIMQAIERFQILIKEDGYYPRQKKEMNELVNWFFSDNSSYIGSYRSICDTLDIHYDKLRGKLEKLLKDKVQRILESKGVNDERSPEVVAISHPTCQDGPHEV